MNSKIKLKTDPSSESRVVRKSVYKGYDLAIKAVDRANQIHARNRLSVRDFYLEVDGFIKLDFFVRHLDIADMNIAPKNGHAIEPRINYYSALIRYLCPNRPDVYVPSHPDIGQCDHADLWDKHFMLVRDVEFVNCSDFGPAPSKIYLAPTKLVDNWLSCPFYASIKRSDKGGLIRTGREMQLAYAPVIGKDEVMSQMIKSSSVVVDNIAKHERDYVGDGDNGFYNELLNAIDLIYVFDQSVGVAFKEVSNMNFEFVGKGACAGNF